MGGAISGLLGGQNSYNYQLPPNIVQRQPNESDQNYQARVSQQYNQQNQGYENVINQAMNGPSLPKNPLDMSASNATAGQQTALAGGLGQRMNQGIDYGTGQNFDQQQQLIDQAMAQSRGEGPNPALDQLRMTTDQNAKQGAAQIASQRGINPALAARLVGQNVANTNQQATGQAALQSAQQQLGAQANAGNLLGQQIGARTQQATNTGQLQQGYANLLSQALQGQRGQDITQSTNQGQTGLGLIGAGTQQESIRRQAQQAYQSQIANIYNNMNNVNAGVAGQNAQTAAGYGQGIMGGIGAALTVLNKGGEVPNYFANAVKNKKVQKKADGGYMYDPSDPLGLLNNQGNPNDPQQRARKAGAQFAGGLSTGLVNLLKGAFAKGPTQLDTNMASGQGPSLGVNTSLQNPLTGQIGGAPQSKFDLGASDIQSPFNDTSGTPGPQVNRETGEWEAMKKAPSLGVTPNWNEGDPTTFDKGMIPNSPSPFRPEMGDYGSLPALASTGGKILGKAKIKGDAEKNDTVPAMLSPGEVVIPRTAMTSPEDAHAFLDKIISQHEGPDYKKVQKAKMKYHNLAHGGEMSACGYCNGGVM